MRSARIMPTFQTMQTFPIVGMGNAGSNPYAKTTSGLGSLPILAWVLLQGGSPYWHGVCYQQLPCQKKSSIRVNFVLDMTTKIWYNSRLDFGRWGACAEKIFSKNSYKLGHWQNSGGFHKKLHSSKILHIPSVEFFFV